MFLIKKYCGKTSSVPNPEVGVEDGAYGIYVKDGEELKFLPYGEYLHGAYECIDIETGEIKYCLCVDGNDILISVLTKKSLDVLKDYGISISDVEEPVFIKMIENDISQKKEITYSSLGFDEIIQNVPIFKGGELIGAEAVGTAERGTLIIYTGEYSVYPQGNIDEWNALCKDEILRSIPMTFLFCASTAGVISDWIKGDALKIHLVEDERGKYTKEAGLFALACGTNGRKFDDGYNPLCFVENIGNSYPCWIDDIVSIEECANIFENPDIHTTFFAVSEKVERKVVDKSCAVPWLELSGIQWMDRYLAHCIKATVSKNYAWWIPIVARRLITWGKIKTQYHIEKAKKEFMKYTSERGVFRDVPETIVNQISMIMAALDIIVEEFGGINKVGITKSDILEFIIRNASVEWYEYKKSDGVDKDGE